MSRERHEAFAFPAGKNDPEDMWVAHR